MQQDKQQNEQRIPDIMNHTQAASFIGISVQQLTTMVKNGEVKTHLFYNGTANHDVYYREELLEAKAKYGEVLKTRMDEYGKGLAIYNFTKKTREEISDVRTAILKIEGEINRINANSNGMNASITDLRSRLDDLRSTAQQLRLGIDKLNASLGNK